MYCIYLCLCVCFYFVALAVSLDFHFLFCVSYVNPAYGCQIEKNCMYLCLVCFAKDAEDWFGCGNLNVFVIKYVMF